MKKAILALVLTALAASPAWADPRRDAVLSTLSAQAKAQDAAFAGFDAKRGEELFRATHATNAETPSCTTCHGASPQAMGKTRAGKEIQPMAVSKTPDRFTDADKIEKWFGRNCNSVLGRACTAREKGDFITFMAAQ